MGRLGEVVLLFLRLGITAWGGPAVSEAMMHDEAVNRRKWLTDQEFLDILGATNLIPGPNATEVAIHLGLLRAGWPGFLSAGIVFILPGMVITIVLGWIYVRFGKLPQVGWVLYGIKPVIIAIIVQAVFRMGRRAVKSLFLAAVLVAATVLNLLGLEEMLLLFGGAAIVLVVRWGKRLMKSGATAILVVPALIKTHILALSTIVPFGNNTLFLTCLKIGSLLYGTGYVLLAFAKSEFVEKLGWLTNAQLIDAIAVGQAVPGPLVKSAAFIGYILGGLPSAIIATVGIFLPSFLMVALLSRMVRLIRKTWWAASFIDGVNAASLGLMASVAVTITRAAVVDFFTVMLALASLVLVFRYRVSSLWLILAGGILGMAYKLLFS